MPIYCEIVSQDRQVFKGDVEMVVLPGEEGEMGILPNHSALLTTLKYGVIKIKRNGAEDMFFTVAGGVAEVLPSQVTILADAAENVAEIDEQRAAAARKRAEDLLKQGPPPDTDTYLKIQAALRRSDLRLTAARKYKQGRR
jgi:F-type H+-transporting ATPase subunit epsilon